MWTRRNPLAAAVMALVLAAGAASAQLSISSQTIDGGGYAFSTGGGFSLGGTVGQPDAGMLTGGTLSLAGGFWLGGTVTSGVSIPPEDPAAPATPLTFRVSPAWPNPFSTSTTLALDLPEVARIRVRIFAPTGRLVTELCERTAPPGHHKLVWNGADAKGSWVASGVYIILVQTGMREDHQRIVLIH